MGGSRKLQQHFLVINIFNRMSFEPLGSNSFLLGAYTSISKEKYNHLWLSTRPHSPPLSPPVINPVKDPFFPDYLEVATAVVVSVWIW